VDDVVMRVFFFFFFPSNGSVPNKSRRAQKGILAYNFGEQTKDLTGKRKIQTTWPDDTKNQQLFMFQLD
jgi:hypothetical protein